MTSDMKNDNPTTRAHELMANQIMRELGFEWDDITGIWLPPLGVTQNEATEAIKKLLVAS